VPAMLMIINADDLGMSQEVNDAIFDLMAERRISSATVMANGPAVRHAAAHLKYFPHCSFGVHLNLTQFEPVTRGPGSRLLVDETGQLSRAIETASPSAARLRAAYEEMCAQIELLASLGQQISHFDSHNHVHTRPLLFPSLKATQRRYGVRKVRIAKNLYTPEQPCSSGLYLKKRIYNWGLRTIYRTGTTDAFTEFLSFQQVRHQRELTYRSIELMVHPGASYAAGELAMLKSNWFGDGGMTLEMIDYRQLPT
jgi:predicted glycoside hydrolase/deacetylase ChbG (UPF0249 family)